MGGMGMSTQIGDATSWATFLYALGILLIVTGALALSRIGRSKMSAFGFLMIVYGAVMVGIGVIMSTMMVAAMQNATILGAGMTVVGLGMLINGALMFQRKLTGASTM
jgi:hypothetical protein